MFGDVVQKICSLPDLAAACKKALRKMSVRHRMSYLENAGRCLAEINHSYGRTQTELYYFYAYADNDDLAICIAFSEWAQREAGT